METVTLDSFGSIYILTGTAIPEGTLFGFNREKTEGLALALEERDLLKEELAKSQEARIREAKAAWYNTWAMGIFIGLLAAGATAAGMLLLN